MSRRHRGRPHQHAHGATDGPRRVTGVTPADGSAGPPQRPPAPNTPNVQARPPEQAAEIAPLDPRLDGAPAPAQSAPSGAATFRPHAQQAPTPLPANGPLNGHANGAPNGAMIGQCTAPQLRRFIKSRPYVPMHELRRRFGIDGDDDDVTPVRLDPGWVYVGLPGREGGLLGELLKAGEIGYELSLDPRTPIVIGVYPMRPIPRG